MAQSESYTFTTFAGQPNIGTADGTGAAARFVNPGGTALDAAGNVYVADTSAHTIRKITPSGVVTTLAGLGGEYGSADGAGAAARFWYPQGVVVDPAGNVWVADTYNHTIRKIAPAGLVTTVAGLAVTTGGADGTGGTARFRSPMGLVCDAAGNLFVGDSANAAVRKVTPAGVVSTVAGLANVTGDADGYGPAARFTRPGGIALDAAGNLYVTDNNRHTVRRITPAGWVTTVAGTSGVAGSVNSTGTAARFNTPSGIAVDAEGNLYVADNGSHVLRKIATTGVVTTLAGQAGGSAGRHGRHGRERPLQRSDPSRPRRGRPAVRSGCEQ